MINIIPKPYNIIDLNKEIIIDGFDIISNNFDKGIQIFKDKYNKGAYKLVIKYRKFNNDSAYNLIVNKDECTVEATTNIGVFYATMSLSQLINIKTSKFIFRFIIDCT